MTTTTQDLFLMIYAPVSMQAGTMQEYTTLAAHRMVTYNHGQAEDVQVLVV